jgi:hypothetical protein
MQKIWSQISAEKYVNAKEYIELQKFVEERERNWNCIAKRSSKK